RVVQRQKTEALAAKRESPVSQSLGMHQRRRLTLEGFDDRYLFCDLVRILVQFPILQQVRHQRMQTVDRNELLREVKRGTEMIHATIRIFRISNFVAGNFASKPKDSWAGSKDRIQLRGFFSVFRSAK